MAICRLRFGSIYSAISFGRVFCDFACQRCFGLIDSVTYVHVTLGSAQSAAGDSFPPPLSVFDGRIHVQQRLSNDDDCLDFLTIAACRTTTGVTVVDASR